MAPVFMEFQGPMASSLWGRGQLHGRGFGATWPKFGFVLPSTFWPGNGGSRGISEIGRSHSGIPAVQDTIDNAPVAEERLF